MCECGACASCNIHEEYKKEGIIPDVIDVVPPEIAQVTFSNGITVNFGNVLTPTDVQGIPTVKWHSECCSFYTLCMTDPDAPSREDPKFREWHHWLVGNIPGTNISGGETLTEYVGAGPPQGSGLHRYVFLIYQQNGKLTFDEPHLTNTSADNRGGFSIRKFAEKYELGEPTAGNFYKAEWDEYVPILYQQLGL